MGGRIALEPAADLKAIHVGHHHVEQHDVAFGALADRQRLGTAMAVTTSKYSAESRASSSFTLAGTSSTTRTRAVIRRNLALRIAKKMTDRFNEFSDRNRLGQIGLAAALRECVLRRPSSQRR